MIASFKSKRLQKCHEADDYRGFRPDMHRKIRQILTVLDVMEDPKGVKLPYLHLHRLKGDRKEQWAVHVNKNYRITFRFVDGCVDDVDFEDYH